MRDGLQRYVLGPALSLGRYYRAVPEDRRVKQVDETLSERHLANLRGFVTRRDMIRSFPRNATAAEIGVAAGDFAEQILAETAPQRLYLIDLWRDGSRASGVAIKDSAETSEKHPHDIDRVNTRFGEEIAAGRILLLRGVSWEKIAEIDEASLDWAYLDAAHNYDSVRKDLEALRPKLKPHGIIAGHDYVRWGRHGFRCGVIEAVHSFCIEHGFEMIGVTFDPKYPPSYAIRAM